MFLSKGSIIVEQPYHGYYTGIYLITDTKTEESRATMSCSEFLELNTACMVVALPELPTTIERKILESHIFLYTITQYGSIGYTVKCYGHFNPCYGYISCIFYEGSVVTFAVLLYVYKN